MGKLKRETRFKAKSLRISFAKSRKGKKKRGEREEGDINWGITIQVHGHN